MTQFRGKVSQSFPKIEVALSSFRIVLMASIKPQPQRSLICLLLILYPVHTKDMLKRCLVKHSLKLFSL